MENRNFLIYFQIVYNPAFFDNDWSCEDKLWDRESGLYTIHRLRSFCVHREVLWKIEIFLKTFTWCTTTPFLTMIYHVKINYGPENQSCTPFTGLVFLKICFRSFWVHWDVLWKIEIFKNTSRWCTTTPFLTMICHVKINYGPENQGCTPFTDWFFA